MLAAVLCIGGCDDGASSDARADNAGQPDPVDGALPGDAGLLPPDAVTADAAPPGAELHARGPRTVGFDAFEVTYVSRGTQQDRTLPAMVWYPTDADPDGASATYTVPGVISIPGGALDRPPVAAGRFPLAVYSHGSGGQALLGYPYGELFASHGWVLVSFEHVGNTALEAVAGNDRPLAINTLDRPGDVSAILDALEGGQGGVAGGAADLDRVFVFGHSFGGYTALAVAGATVDGAALRQRACDDAAARGDDDCGVFDRPETQAALAAGLADDRVDAIAAQAPGVLQFFNAESYAAVDVPVLLQSGALDRTTPLATTAEPVWEGLSGADDRWLHMPAGAHYSFVTICTDLMPDILALFRPDAANDGCGPEFIDTTRAIPVLAAYTLAFARRHVLGETEWDAMLDGAPADAGFELRTR
jgi:predicted dienelactone hydrolase